ncbi:MAG: GlsB/YeaQ/YmgE family stress response membrane protein [Lysobacteraceae bacterium]
MSIIWTILIGLVVGIVARFIKPGKDAMGWIMTILLGIGGSFVGTYIGRALNLYAEGQAAGFIMSVIGAIILLLIWGLVTKKK